MPNARLARFTLPLAAAAVFTTGFAQPPARPAQTRWVLTCDMESSAGARRQHIQRTFRLGPKQFEEWRPETRAWGYNLCSSFPCRADAERLEGQISSPTLVLTIRLDRNTGAGSWTTQGASGLARASGACTVQPESAAKLPQ